MTRVLSRSLHVACAVEHAFEVFTGKVDIWWPRTHRRFDASQMRLEPVEGGRFVEVNGSGETARLGEVVACEPPHLIRYTWYPGSISSPTLVEIRFAAEAGGTRVDVRHSEAAAALGAAWEEKARLFRTGWGIILPAFQVVAQARAVTGETDA